MKKDLKDEIVLIRQQNNKTKGRLRMRVDRRENPIWRVIQNIKTDFVDFRDKNTNIDDDHYDFASMENIYLFMHNKSQTNVTFGYDETFQPKREHLS